MKITIQMELKLTKTPGPLHKYSLYGKVSARL